MKIMEKIQRKARDNANEGAVTIAFLGDSVTQGCFEIYPEGNSIGVVFDDEDAYHNCLCKILRYLYPTVPVNVIKAGISGAGAPHGLKRLEEDVLKFQPDLVVICYGLNDVANGRERVDEYKKALGEIFYRLKQTQAEVIFMTPNMLNTKISPFVPDGIIRQVAEMRREDQNNGGMNLYMDAAREICKEHNIRLCDCYKKWKTLEKNGVDTTRLLCNHINHPCREMSWLFAISLIEIMMED